MKNLEIELQDDKGNNWTIDLFEHSTEEAILEHINGALQEQAEQDEEHEEEEGRAKPFEEVTGFEVIDWGEVPSKFQKFDSDLEELCEALQTSSYDIEVFEAAKDCDIQLSDVDEAYAGEYASDEDFARQLAEDIGAINNNASWPNNCIDWEFAAKELMHDYSSSDGHYFRNL